MDIAVSILYNHFRKKSIVHSVRNMATARPPPGSSSEAVIETVSDEFVQAHFCSIENVLRWCPYLFLKLISLF